MCHEKTINFEVENSSYLQFFTQNRVLFATNGDKIRTPSIEWSKQTYANIAPELYVVDGNKKWALSCFLEILEYAALKNFKYIIYIDADCFITSILNLKNIFTKFKNGGFAFAGMPDGGCVPVRIHNKFLINPFFSMFNVSLCNENLNYEKLYSAKVLSSLDDVNLRNLESTLSQCPNAAESKFSIDCFENYYKLFSQLAVNHKIMYLIAGQLPCKMSPVTVIYDGIAENKNAVCIHSWYARKTDKINMSRIRDIFQLSKTFSN